MNFVGLTFLGLLSYPLITLLWPEPHAFRWWWRMGGRGVAPRELIDHRKRSRGNVLVVKFAAIIGTCVVLLRQGRVSSQELGFRIPGWYDAIAFGRAAGAILIWWTRGMNRVASQMKVSQAKPNDLLREPSFKILLIILLGGFAEELWRAMSLILFHKAGISDVSAVLVTSLIFGIGHVFSYKSVGAAVGRSLPPAIAGILLAALFLIYQTLLVPFVAHVMLNLYGTALGRK